MKLKKILLSGVLTCCVSCLGNISYALTMTNQQAEKIADSVYKKANLVWERLIADEAQQGIVGKDALSNINDDNYHINTIKILDKYCYNYRKPRVISHEEFEKQKVDKTVLYRGIKAETHKVLDERTKQLFSGKFADGAENSGIFASVFKEIKDIDGDISTSTEAAAEYYAIEGCQNGRIYSFFYDPHEVNVLHDPYTVKEIYNKKYFDHFSDWDCMKKASAKDLFLSMCLGYYPLETKCLSRILNCDAVETHGWQYQIFNPGILVFDAEYQDIEKIATDDVRFGTSRLILDKSGQSEQLYEVLAGPCLGTKWKYTETGEIEVIED